MPSSEAIAADVWPPRWKRYYNANGTLKYMCKHSDIDAVSTSNDWMIWYYTYTGDGLLDETEGPRYGQVDSESGIDAMSWNIS